MSSRFRFGGGYFFNTDCLFLCMTKASYIPNNLKQSNDRFEGDYAFASKSSKKESTLKELEAALTEAREIRDGKKAGLTLDQILSS
mgnify:CR=1 FL=1